MLVLLLGLAFVVISLILFTQNSQRTLAIGLLFIGLLFLGWKFFQDGKIGQFLNKTSPPTSSTSPSSQTSIRKGNLSDQNPFGVMLGNQVPDLTLRMKTAKDLGALYYRPLSIFVSTWNGSFPEADAAIAAGLKLILTVRNDGGAGTPTNPPKDLNAYKTVLGQIVDKYHPEILIIENEENSSLFYTGSPSDFHQELKAGCEVAHARSAKCANGGLVSSLVALLTANDIETHGQGKAAANAYLAKTLPAKIYTQYQKLGTTTAPEIAVQVNKGLELLRGYRQDGADFVNFHWYAPDATKLAQAVAYLEKTTGLKAITNEWGQQQNENPEQITADMSELVRLNIPYAVEFSIDVSAGEQARALVNSDGSLRANGKAFKDFIAAK